MSPLLAGYFSSHFHPLPPVVQQGGQLLLLIRSVIVYGNCFGALKIEHRGHRFVGINTVSSTSWSQVPTTPPSQRSPLPRFFPDSYGSAGTGARAFISLPASATGGLRGSARLRAPGDLRPPGVADPGPRSVQTAPPRRAGQAGSGTASSPYPAPSLPASPPPPPPPPTPPPPRRLAASAVCRRKIPLPPSDYEPKRPPPQNISPGKSLAYQVCNPPRRIQVRIRL